MIYIVLSLVLCAALYLRYTRAMLSSLMHCTVSLEDLGEWLDRNGNVPIRRSVVGRELLMNALRAHRRHLLMCLSPKERSQIREALEFLVTLISENPDPKDPSPSSRPIESSSFIALNPAPSS